MSARNIKVVFHGLSGRDGRRVGDVLAALAGTDGRKKMS